MDTEKIVMLIIGLIMSIGNIFIYCFVGSFTTDNFFRYAEISYESLWYQLPVNLQQYLRLIISNAQRPQIFNGLRIFDLSFMLFTRVLSKTLRYTFEECRISLEIFVFQVLNGSLSYYLMFKSLTEA